jgi:hypothetical protein
MLSKADDRLALARGLDIRVHDGRQIAALMRVLHDLAATSIAAGSVAPLMEWLYANANAATDHFAGDLAIACRRGCAHCCHMWVDASPPEVIFLANALVALSGAAGQAAVDIGRAQALTGPMSFVERAAFVHPCPLLKAGECSVHAVRPIACRSAASTSAAVCERAYNLQSNERIPQPLAYALLGVGYRVALAGALKRAGLSYGAVELNSALSAALADPGTEQRWLAGEDVSPPPTGRRGPRCSIIPPTRRSSQRRSTNISGRPFRPSRVGGGGAGTKER